MITILKISLRIPGSGVVLRKSVGAWSVHVFGGPWLVISRVERTPKAVLVASIIYTHNIILYSLLITSLGLPAAYYPSSPQTQREMLPEHL